MIAGSSDIRDSAKAEVMPATNSAIPRLSVIALSVHASVRMRIGATIALKPSGMQSMAAVNPMTLLSR